MIKNQDEIRAVVAQVLAHLAQDSTLAADFSDVFLVEVQLLPDEQVQVFIDHLQGVQFTHCEILSRALEVALDKEVQDFELEVSSYGLTSPLVMREHYIKHQGQILEITTTEKRKFFARLLALQEDHLASLEVLPEGFKKKAKNHKKPAAVLELLCLDIHKQIYEAKLVLPF